MFHTRYTRMCQICTAVEMIISTMTIVTMFMYMVALA